MKREARLEEVIESVAKISYLENHRFPTPREFAEVIAQDEREMLEKAKADQRRECGEELEWILPEQSKGDDLWQCFWDNSKKLISKWKQDNTREGMKAEQQKISDKLKAILCNPDGECCISGTDADRDIIDEAIEELQVLENTRQLERIDGGDLNDVLMMIDPKKICPDDTTYHFGVITDAISSRFGTSRQDIEKAKADQRRECAEEMLGWLSEYDGTAKHTLADKWKEDNTQEWGE